MSFIDLSIFDDFEATFLFFDNLINLRIQSIFMDIDIVKEKIFEQINSIEHKILNNEATIQIIELDSKIFEIEKNSIGTIYNEFDQYNGYKLDLASTHEPPSIAAGCILLVCEYYNIPLSKKNISEVTISKNHRKIKPYQKIILSNKITDLIV